MEEKDWMVEGQVIRVKRGRIWEANSCGVIEMSSGASVWAVNPKGLVDVDKWCRGDLLFRLNIIYFSAIKFCEEFFTICLLVTICSLFSEIFPLHLLLSSIPHCSQLYIHVYFMFYFYNIYPPCFMSTLA